MDRFIEIAGRRIGPGCPVYVIAEISANHNQDYSQAEELIRQAKDAGADAVKLQTYTADTLTIDCDNEYFRVGKGSIWEGKNLYKLYEEAYTPWDWQGKLKSFADEIGITLFSTPFDASAVDFLEGLEVPAHKIASFEIVDIPLLKKVAQTGKPVIMSTGMASEAEITEALQVLRSEGCEQIALLKCTSAYPASPSEMNLRTIPDMADRFEVPVGLSDHSMAAEVSIAAVALGACILEKHFTLSRSIKGPDSSFSLEPDELKDIIMALRVTEQALGKVNYHNTEQEEACKIFRKSLFVVKDVKKGDAFTEENVRSIRPGHGLHPRFFEKILTCRATEDIKRGTPLSEKLLLEME